MNPLSVGTNSVFIPNNPDFCWAFINPLFSKSSKPQTKNMLVLGELHRGVKQFEDIQKNTGLTTEELNSILEDLENNGLMKAQQKSGLFGMKTELVPTDKGFKEYYS